MQPLYQPHQFSLVRQGGDNAKVNKPVTVPDAIIATPNKGTNAAEGPKETNTATVVNGGQTVKGEMMKPDFFNQNE